MNDQPCKRKRPTAMFILLGRLGVAGAPRRVALGRRSRVALGRFGSFWVVLGRFGSFWAMTGLPDTDSGSLWFLIGTVLLTTMIVHGAKTNSLLPPHKKRTSATSEESRA